MLAGGSFASIDRMVKWLNAQLLVLSIIVVSHGNWLMAINYAVLFLSEGYNFQCDMHQLSGSYPKLACFKRYEMLLDIQKVFKEACGGLSGLVKVTYPLIYFLILIPLSFRLHVVSCASSIHCVFS